MSKLNKNFSIHNSWGITDEERSGRTLSLKHLASQVSGLPRDTPCDNDCKLIQTTEMLQRLSRLRLVHPTDVQPSYSNLAFSVLGNLLSEYIGDKSFNVSLLDNIIGPAGMNLNHTGLYLNNIQSSFAVTGYSDGEAVEYYDLGWDAPAGQLFSSVRDLSKLLMQYFAAYPSLYQQNVNNDYNFIVSPQNLREMLRPVFLNPDQRTGFGSPWELYFRDGHLVRTKSGNVDGFASEIAMIPELKLGVVVLVSCSCNGESLLTTSALDILIPAYTNWINEAKAKNFKAPKVNMYEDLMGDFGYGGEPVLKIYRDRMTGYPLLSAPSLLAHGVLTPIQDNLQDDDSVGFIFNSLYSNADFCFTTTIEAIDGLVLTLSDKNSGKFQTVTVDGLDYGLKLTRINRIGSDTS